MPGLLTRRTAITIATACSLILTVSCASSRRMARSSPFSDEPESSIRQTAKSGTDSSLKLARKTDNPPDLNVNQERINFWPLVYSRPELFTILWPMADFDKNGMAVRPFYVRDGDEYSVLFPLAAWNPVNKDGWVLNTYWEKSFNGSFPVYHLGPEFNYVMPVWWTPESIGFPGFCFSRNAGLNYGGPFWYNSASGSGGFFPLCYQKSSGYGWFFPLYYYDSEKDNSIYLPLYGALGHYRNNHGDKSLMALIYYHSMTKNDNTVNDMLLPLYLYRRNDGWNTVLTLPFMYSSDSKSNDYWVDAVGPLFYRNVKGDESYTGILWPLGGYSYSPEKFIDTADPLFYRNVKKSESNVGIMLAPGGYSYTPEKSAAWAIPFFFKEKDKTSDCMYIFPYYYENNSDNTKQIRSVIPFYHQKTSPDINSLWVFPYYQDSGRDKPSSCAVFPLFYYGGKENDLLLMPLLSNFSSKRADILFPLIGYGYQDHSFRFWPAVSVNENAPSLLVNIDKNGFSFIGPFGFKYHHYISDQLDETEIRSLLLMASSSEKRNAVFPPENIYMHSSNSPNMIEQEKDFYFLYFRNAERSKIWNPALIQQKDVFELSNNYSQYQSASERIRQHIDAEQRYPASSDKIKKMRLEQMEKYKKEMAVTRGRLIAAMQKYGMQAGCGTEEELTTEIKKFADKYTAIENHGNAVFFPLFFSGYKETPVKSGSGKSAFSKTGYSLFIPLYYGSFEDDESYDNFLFFMAESTSRPNYSSFRVLRYLYHAEEQNDKYSYDIFPFISTRGSKEFSSYSFGWHLLDVRKDKQTGRRSGYICFIPF